MHPAEEQNNKKEGKKMGWAKYQEDNNELGYDRLYMQEAPQFRPTTHLVSST